MKLKSEMQTDKNSMKLINYLDKCRKNIPDKYNQGELLNFLADDKTDLLFSITTRGDGKTFNYLYLLAKLAIKFKFRTLILVRHMEVRNAMISQIEDVFDTFKDFDVKKFEYFLQPDFVTIKYGTETPFIIADLNNANDLKNYSSVLRKCNLTLYDEFLAVGGDYAYKEFDKFKTIFETMDRAEIEPMEFTNHKRKALFLGNPVDFSSEFLSVWKMFHMLETQEMNTIQRHNNITIERRKNVAPQKNKNSKIFENIGENESLTGKFKLNNFHIKEPKNTLPKITVKLKDKFLNIYLDDPLILEVSAYEDKYTFNTEIEDNIKNSTYIKSSYYSDSGERYFAKDKYNFANNFSKKYLLENYSNLNIKRIVKRVPINNEKVEEQTFKRATHEALKDRLIREYFL